VYQLIDQETKAPVFIIKNGLDSKGCKGIIEALKDKTHTAFHSKGKTLSNKTDGPRDSTVHFFMDPQLKETLDNWVTVANYQAGWRYELDDQELFQFTKYVKNQHYNWHLDGNGCHHCVRHFTFGKPNSLLEVNQPTLAGTVRKISVSAVLNDDYEGGEFQTMHLDNGKTIVSTIKPRTGDVIIFPSYLTHRVKPVTKGIRYSIVAWYGGPPFK